MGRLFNTTAVYKDYNANRDVTERVIPVVALAKVAGGDIDESER